MMPDAHLYHELVAATARMAHRGLVTFVLCLDCRAILRQQPAPPQTPAPGLAGAPQQGATTHA